LSNLLKKEDDMGVILFGFPEIEQQGKQKPIPIPVHDEIVESEIEEPAPVEPEIDMEEVFRKRLLELERQGQEIEKEAYAKGFAQGEKDGLEYGQKSVQVVKVQLEGIARNLESLPGKICLDYRNWLVQTSLRLARKIVQRELRITPEIVADTVSDLLAEAEDSSSITVYLNPQDLEFMERRADLDLNANAKHLLIKTDRTLERGGCKLESEVQLLDASIETQFKNLDKFLLSQMHTAGPPSAPASGNEVRAGMVQNGK
jgi:flagellar assembly protein FliH